MGVQNLFKNADFSGIFETNEKFEAEISHKAKIEIDETGTTAAASTVLKGMVHSLPPRFECNHPFMFVIYDEKINEILFAGIFRGPN